MIADTAVCNKHVGRLIEWFVVGGGGALVRASPWPSCVRGMVRISAITYDGPVFHPKGGMEIVGVCTLVHK